jgi:hypothetical protein
MDNTPEDPAISPAQIADDSPYPEHIAEEFKRIRSEFQSRLIVANLQTEAVRAGIVDLDGLKLIDLVDVQLGPDDKVVGGRKIIDELRRNRPWLFGTSSSSSVAEAPASKPVRQRTAIEMTEAEYRTARAALIKRRY